jgi:hypothetical protein
VWRVLEEHNITNVTGEGFHTRCASWAQVVGLYLSQSMHATISVQPNAILALHSKPTLRAAQ